MTRTTNRKTRQTIVALFFGASYFVYSAFWANPQILAQLVSSDVSIQRAALMALAGLWIVGFTLGNRLWQYPHLYKEEVRYRTSLLADATYLLRQNRISIRSVDKAYCLVIARRARFWMRVNLWLHFFLGVLLVYPIAKWYWALGYADSTLAQAVMAVLAGISFASLKPVDDRELVWTQIQSHEEIKQSMKPNQSVA